MTTATEARTVTYSPAGMTCTNYETIINLQHRKTGEEVRLIAWTNHETLSAKEFRDLISDAMGSHWDWRKVSWEHEFAPF